MTACPPHHTGPSCEWPECLRGKLDPSTKTCSCYSGFALPHCADCVPGRWGSDCDKEVSSPVTSLPAVPFIPEALVFLIASIVLVAVIVVLRRICRPLPDAIPLRSLPSHPPPPYEAVAKEQPPPPYIP